MREAGVHLSGDSSANARREPRGAETNPPLTIAAQSTNVDLVMIGRQAAKKPWIFKQIKEFKETGKILKEPTEKEILEIMLKHIKKLFELEGEVVGARKARSAAIRYFGGFKNAAKR